MERDGVALAYEARGRDVDDAPSVVLVEGLGYGRWMWRWLADDLAAEYHVLVPDNRGTGDSDAPEGPYTIEEMAADLDAVLADAGVEEVHVVGASMGGMIAMRYALDFERARSLALLSTAHGGEDAVPIPEATLERMFSVPEDADVDAADLDLVLFHGSEYKDHVVWSAAADVADRLGADDAYAHESYALCAGAPVAIRHTAAQIRVGDVDRALLVGASREEDLVDYADGDASFMFNFGSGAAAMVLEAGTVSVAAEDDGGVGGGDDGHDRDGEDVVGDVGDDGPAAAGDRVRAVVRDSAAVTDGSFSRDVIMPAGGSVDPPSVETVEAGEHTLTVPDPEGMKERLGDVSAPAFLRVADEALSGSGYDRDDQDFVALTHMKRSFHEHLVDELGVADDGNHYLDRYGHVQSADQGLALAEGLDRGHLAPGDVVLLLAAGTGYTWAATVFEWIE